MTEQELKEKLEEVNSLLRELRQLWSLEQEEMPDNECADASALVFWFRGKGNAQLGWRDRIPNYSVCWPAPRGKNIGRERGGRHGRDLAFNRLRTLVLREGPSEDAPGQRLMGRRGKILRWSAGQIQPRIRTVNRWHEARQWAGWRAARGYALLH